MSEVITAKSKQIDRCARNAFRCLLPAVASVALGCGTAAIKMDLREDAQTWDRLGSVNNCRNGECQRWQIMKDKSGNSLYTLRSERPEVAGCKGKVVVLTVPKDYADNIGKEIGDQLAEAMEKPGGEIILLILHEVAEKRVSERIEQDLAKATSALPEEQKTALTRCFPPFRI